MFDLRLLNSLTKYPSIPTYHALDPRNGGLTEDATVFAGDVVATEKVDGTNSRIVQLPDGMWLLGSREEFLHAKGDLIANPALGIVEQLKPVASRLPGIDGGIRVYFLELYGGKVGGAAKQYTSDTKRFGWRLFDVVTIEDLGLLERSPEQISAWREGGGQPFAGEAALTSLAAGAGLELTPRLPVQTPLPSAIPEMYELLKATLPETLVGLDGTAGRSEGIVFRAPDRSVIAKARFQDYERTLRRKRP